MLIDLDGVLNIYDGHFDEKNIPPISDGAYEFIEDGVYHPVLRGTSTLDAVQPDRSKWTWGDIYRQAVVCYKFDIEKGIYHENL